MPAFLLPREHTFVQTLRFHGGPGVGTRTSIHLRHEDHFPGARFALLRLDLRHIQAADGERHAIGSPHARGAVHILERLPPGDGRQAFQYMYGSSRMWATDSMPLTIRSLNVSEVKPEKGKAGAWEVVFVSQMNTRARTYTWSAVEAEGLHKGVFPGQQESWHGGGPNQPFSPALL